MFENNCSHWCSSGNSEQSTVKKIPNLYIRLHRTPSIFQRIP
ncbi:hypothetical protein Bhyg_01820 [Pseudolycoriella hygida]|uniref:Uncharacterized protein n=1 Tax=Pseudolycoriella hygida TaxID=35572 RepID=A0A9Q0NA62_9DIPT|nr:hypothetical protein Bhyg_01820 [Pseudolycoriella hygida]